MPSLAKHQSSKYIKLLLLGDAKSGKTGSLVSLVKAGYKLRIIDMDNLLDSLRYQILEQCPDKIENVEFRTLRDRRKMTPLGSVIEGSPKAFVNALEMIDHWRYLDEESGEIIDHGKPSEWGPDYILVIDSLSRLCDACYDWREPLTPKGKGGQADGRAVYGDAQDAVENTLGVVTGKNFRTNVIVIAHGTYMDLEDGTKKIFPQGVGQKLSPKIPQYFPNYIRYKNTGGKRTIQTDSDIMIDLAISNRSKVKTTYDINGLAELFEALRPPPGHPDAPKQDATDEDTPRAQSPETTPVVTVANRVAGVQAFKRI